MISLAWPIGHALCWVCIHACILCSFILCCFWIALLFPAHVHPFHPVCFIVCIFYVHITHLSCYNAYVEIRFCFIWHRITRIFIHQYSHPCSSFNEYRLITNYNNARNLPTFVSDMRIPSQLVLHCCTCAVPLNTMCCLFILQMGVLLGWVRLHKCIISHSWFHLYEYLISTSISTGRYFPETGHV